MSIADKLSRLSDARDDIIDALGDKGVTATGHGFEDFATDISGISGGGVLPSGYTQLAYVESPGSIIKDTSFTPNANTTVVCEFQMTASASANEAIYGADEFFFFRRSSGEYRAATNVAYYDFANDYYRRWHIITQTPTGAIFTRNGSPQIGTMTAGSPSNSIYIFGFHGTSTFTSKARISVLKIWNGEALARDYIPAKRDSDNYVGFYDVVNDSFLYSTSFIAGPKIGPVVFYVENNSLQDPKMYTADRGMTWEQYCDTDYNIDGFSIATRGGTSYVDYDEDYAITYSTTGHPYVLPSDTITNGTVYVAD